VAEMIVHLLEAVEIDEQQGGAVVGRPRLEDAVGLPMPAPWWP
jgi:hypothetical protein